ncbi:MAG: sensor domain-containing diguanylate cyclase [Chloroflexi bacterium]|nr:sensor domain-containing diguanylate cyclase [Chloroflexota bacterium]
MPRGDGAAERLLRRATPVTWVLLSLLGLVAALAILDGPVRPLEVLQLALVAAVGLGILAQRRAEAVRADRREAREASFGRLLQGLSRSVSPESVVQAIVQELCVASGAGHVVISRLRRADRVLETTLVSARDAVPPSTSFLPSSVLEPEPAVGSEPGLSARARLAAEQVAARMRSDYGLRDTLAAPLVDGKRIVGALVIAHRAGRSWPSSSQRLLDWAAEEVSLALARAHAYADVEQQANLDALTGLPNRRYFDELAGVIRLGRRAGDSIGVLMIDIDRFKSLNDRFGHAAGDRVLRAVAGAITTSIRGEDTPARYGGEEFVVILKRATRDQAAEVAERVRAAVASLGEEQLGVAGQVSVSVGLAVSGSQGGGSFGELVELADTALYEAKRLGRDRVVVS